MTEYLNFETQGIVPGADNINDSSRKASSLTIARCMTLNWLSRVAASSLHAYFLPLELNCNRCIDLSRRVNQIGPLAAEYLLCSSRYTCDTLCSEQGKS